MMIIEQGCICNSFADLASVPMGGAGLDEKFLRTTERVKSHGPDKWWLWLGKCSDCAQHWLIAQEERIFDEYFLRKLTPEQARDIVQSDKWPAEFSTYENLLQIGATVAKHCYFLERTAPSLVWAAEDLRNERPDITVSEIASLLGVGTEQANEVVAAIGTVDLSQGTND